MKCQLFHFNHYVQISKVISDCSLFLYFSVKFAALSDDNFEIF